jgi:membrane metallo-endopeptidase-like protein 1
MTDYSAKYLTTALKKRQLQYSAAISGQEEQEPRWKECIDLTSTSLPTALSASYVRQHFKHDSKVNALKMVDAIKLEFENILKTVPWMSDKTRELALLKVKAMHTHIGHPDELADDYKLTEFYKPVAVDEEMYLESVLSINRFDSDREFRKLREKVNKTDWINHSKQAQVNAFYSSVENSISESTPVHTITWQIYPTDLRFDFDL